MISLLEEEFGISDGFITTLHPWLGYQNLLDGNLKSVSSPGHFFGLIFRWESNHGQPYTKKYNFDASY